MISEKVNVPQHKFYSQMCAQYFFYFETKTTTLIEFDNFVDAGFNLKGLEQGSEFTNNAD